MTLLDPRSRRPQSGSPPNDDEGGQRESNRMPVEAAFVAIAINLVIVLAVAICLAAIGNRIGLEIVTGSGGRYGPGWEGGLAIAAFTIFFAMVSVLVCIPRKLVLSWIFTVFSMFFLLVTVIATATSFHSI